MTIFLFVACGCEGCHEEYSAESVEYRYRISVVASDRTQLAQITVFGSCLDRFFGTSATDFARFDLISFAIIKTWLSKKSQGKGKNPRQNMQSLGRLPTAVVFIAEKIQ